MVAEKKEKERVWVRGEWEREWLVASDESASGAGISANLAMLCAFALPRFFDPTQSPLA